MATTHSGVTAEEGTSSTKLFLGVALGAAAAAAGVYFYKSAFGNNFRPASTYASPYNAEKAAFRASSDLAELFVQMREEYDLHGPVVGQIQRMVDLIGNDPDKWVPELLGFDGHVRLFKLMGNYDPDLRQLPLDENDRNVITEIVQLASVLSKTQEGLEAIMQTRYVATDLFHAIFYTSGQSQRELLQVMKAMAKTSEEGVARLVAVIEYYMYIAHKESFLQSLTEDLEQRTENLLEVLELLLVLAQTEQPSDLNVPNKALLLSQSRLAEALEALNAQDLSNAVKEVITALQSELQKEVVEDEGRRVIDPTCEVLRYEKKVDRWNRYSAGMWEATPAAFPAGIRKYQPHEQEGALLRVRNLSREARFASGLRKRDINREIASICGGVDQEFFKGMLHASGMFNATREFIDTALKYDNTLTDDDIHKAGRNFWTCLSLQLLLCGNDVNYQNAIYAYSMLYPYTDDYIDSNEVPLEDKKKFNAKFRHWLAGTGNEPPSNPLEVKVKDMVELIEGHWDRETHPGVYGSLLAIQDAQTNSMKLHGGLASPEEIFEGAFDKGGTSVMADAWLVAGELTDKQSAFAFNFGVALQILDDIQDVRRDVRDNQDTMCTIAFKQNHPEEFEILTRRLLNFLYVLINPESSGITDKTSDEYHMRNSMVNMCYSIVLKAIAKDCYLFTENFAKEIEWYSPLPFSSMKKIVMIKKLMTLVRKDQI